MFGTFYHFIEMIKRAGTSLFTPVLNPILF